MKLSRTEWILQIVLSHFLVLFVGLFSIYYIECRINVRSREMAQTAAEALGNLPDTGWTDLQKDIRQAEEMQRVDESKELQSSEYLNEPEQYLTYSECLEKIC